MWFGVKMKSVLIVGGDSVIGSAVANVLKARGLTVYLTTRTDANPKAGVLYLDLEDTAHLKNFPEVDSVLICAAVSKLAECEKDPVRARRVNVEAPKAIVGRYKKSKTSILCLSTNQVFSGEQAFVEVEAPFSWRTVYGEMKAKMEKEIIAEAGQGNVSILRMTKVITPSFPLFGEWVKALENGRGIRPFSDMKMAPVSLMRCVSVICNMLDQKVSGVYQLSGDEEISYVDAAQLIAGKLGCSQKLVMPTMSSEAGLRTYVPPHTSLRQHLLEGDCPQESWQDAVLSGL